MVTAWEDSLFGQINEVSFLELESRMNENSWILDKVENVKCVKYSNVTHDAFLEAGVIVIRSLRLHEVFKTILLKNLFPHRVLLITWLPQGHVFTRKSEWMHFFIYAKSFTFGWTLFVWQHGQLYTPVKFEIPEELLYSCVIYMTSMWWQNPECNR